MSGHHVMFIGKAGCSVKERQTETGLDDMKQERVGGQERGVGGGRGAATGVLIHGLVT